MNNRELVKLLNEALSTEWACFMRLVIHAHQVKGLDYEVIEERIQEMANDELAHIHQLCERIVSFDGVPTTTVAPFKLGDGNVNTLIRLNIKEEEEAIERYQNLLSSLDTKNPLLYETVEHILMEEQKHLEELHRLKGD